MIAHTFAVGPLHCNCTILADETTGEAIVVDGGDGCGEVAGYLNARGWRAKLLLHTHAHIDHIGDLGRLRELTGAKAFLHHADLPLYHALPWQARWLGLETAPDVVSVDGQLEDGDIFELGTAKVGVLHTPGHTPGSVSFAVDDGVTTRLLTGDTLFAGSIGRWDLGGSSMRDIVASIESKLLVYDDATPVVPGHGPQTTIGLERISNPYLRA